MITMTNEIQFVLYFLIFKKYFQISGKHSESDIRSLTYDNAKYLKANFEKQHFWRKTDIKKILNTILQFS